MSDRVASLAAIPLLGAATSPPGRAGIVVGVLYLDSYEDDAFVDETLIDRVIRMCEHFLASLPTVTGTRAGRIANTEFWERKTMRDVPPHTIDPASWQALQLVAVDPPGNVGLRHLNFDFSDFTPVEQT
jgi:hypothetical protein